MFYETKEFANEVCSWTHIKRAKTYFFCCKVEVCCERAITFTIKVIWRVTFILCDVIDYCSAPSLKIAVITLELINEVFWDVNIPDELYELVSHKEQLHLVSTINVHV